MSTTQEILDAWNECYPQGSLCFDDPGYWADVPQEPKEQEEKE